MKISIETNITCRYKVIPDAPVSSVGVVGLSQCNPAIITLGSSDVLTLIIGWIILGLIGGLLGQYITSVIKRRRTPKTI